MSGSAIHPTESAGDGSLIDQSRYIKKSDNLDKIIECAQCGYPVNLDRRSTGPSMGAIAEGSATAKTGTGTPPGPGIAFTDAYADPVDTNSGCPLCNSMNPKGIGRGRTGFERPKSGIENF